MSLFVLLVMPCWVHAKAVLVLGDSISAAYGLEKVDQGWVSLLQKQILSRGWTVVNASISGETSAGGSARIDELLKQYRPDLVILELGANDGLRGLSPKQMASNLGQVISRSKDVGAEVLLLGMRIPPNYGRRYAEMFENVYPELASRYHVALIPFFLEGIGGQIQLMQADGLHPNREAQTLLFGLVWKKLETMLKN